MCFYQDTQILSKRIFSNLGVWEESQDSKTSKTSKNEQEALINDTLIKKKKILDGKAPGLFEHLTKISQDDISTDVTSVGSEIEPDEAKPLLHIPVPRKTSTQIDSTHNLSGVVKGPVQRLPEAVPAGNEKVESKSGTGAVEEEQQQRILYLIMQNTMMLNNAMIQHECSRKMVMECMDAVTYFKKFNDDSQKSHLERLEKIQEDKRNSSTYNSNPTSTLLFNHLFGNDKHYRYELILDGELPQPIFRERNISIKVKLVDTMNGEVVKHENKVTLNLFLQTWEVPSTPIQRNKAGNKAIMGETEVELKEGEANFERIQINEVTSKFIHGHVAMVILPTKPLNHGTSLNDHAQSDRYVGYEEIKPLMLEKVIVKSKKKNTNKKSEK